MSQPLILTAGVHLETCQFPQTFKVIKNLNQQLQTIFSYS